MPYDVGIIGCGTIGSELVAAIEDGEVGDTRVTCLFDRTRDKAAELARTSERAAAITVADTPTAVVDHADLVVEAAGQSALWDVLVPVFDADTDLVVMSVGAFADKDLYETALDATRASNGHLYVPSGALADLDAVKATSVGELHSVQLTTRKPPAGLAGAPHIETAQVDLDSMEETTTVFEGTATDAATAFPSNINVALALSLAARVDPDETTVRIVATPNSANNVHQVRVTGEAGSIETKVQNVPSPTNPQTSYLAVLSAIETLRSITIPFSVGT